MGPTSVLQRFRWPPFELGLKTPANLALLSAERRQQFLRTSALALLLGILTALLLAVLDHFLFGGVSAQRARTLAQSTTAELAIVVAFAAVTEEVAFRLGIATAVAAIAFMALRSITPRAAVASVWFGIIAAALVFGLAHVGNLPNVPHPYLRAITLDGLAALVLGYLYWFHGLESAVLAHLAADITIYFGLAHLVRNVTIR